MAGYVKIWTTISNNDAFLSLSCLERGAYLQLIIAAKMQRDDGTVCARSLHALSMDWACDRRTCDKVMTKLSQKSLCSHSINEDGVITITLPNYKRWQEITVDEVRQTHRKNVAKIPSLRPDQTIAEQTRSDHSGARKKSAPKSEKKSEKNPDHQSVIEYWSEKHLAHYKIKYQFQGGADGKRIRELLEAWGYEKLTSLIDQLFCSKDDFYERGGGRTIGVLYACANKLAQEIARPVKGGTKIGHTSGGHKGPVGEVDVSKIK